MPLKPFIEWNLAQPLEMNLSMGIDPLTPASYIDLNKVEWLKTYINKVNVGEDLVEVTVLDAEKGRIRLPLFQTEGEYDIRFEVAVKDGPIANVRPYRVIVTKKKEER